jgi:hypothetical protein
MERILGGEPVSATASAAVSTASVSTARDLLLNGDGELSQALAHPNVEAGLGRLGDAAGRAVDHEIAALLERLLDIELVDVLAQGWRKHATLTAAARRTLAESDAREVVGLPTHRVHLEHEPSLELMVDGVQTGQVEVELSIVLDVRDLEATVRSGAIVALSGGRCTATGRLAVEGVEVARRSAAIDPRRAVPGEGLRLLAQPAFAA